MFILWAYLFFKTAHHKLASSATWYQFTIFLISLCESFRKICLLVQHPQTPSSCNTCCTLLVHSERFIQSKNATTVRL